jgi:uncharacterized protein YukE
MKLRLVAATVVLALAGCDSPTRTVETARTQLATYQAAPDPVKQAAVEKSLAKLDDQIANLEKIGDRSQADQFRNQAVILRTQFQAAKMAQALNEAKNAIQGIGKAFEEAGKGFTEVFKNSGTNNP